VNKQTLIILLVIALGLFLRAYYPFTQDNLIGSDSYYHYRIAEYYADNGQLPANDDLYYGSRPYTYLPLFHVILGEGYGLFGITFLKVFPLLAYAAFIFVAYIIFRKWFPLLILATMPVLLYKQAGYLLTDNLVLLFIALLTYFMLNKNLPGFLITLIFYSLTHQSVLLFSFIFAFISIFMMVRKKKGYTIFLLMCMIPHLIIFALFGQHILNVSENVPLLLSQNVYGFEGIGFFIMMQLTIPIILLCLLFIYKFDLKSIEERFWVFLILLSPVILYATRMSTLDRSLAYASLPIAYFAGQGLSKIKNKQIFRVVVGCAIILSLISAVLAVNQLKWGVMDDKEKEALSYLSSVCGNKTVMTYNFGHWITKNGCVVYADDIYDNSSNERYSLIFDVFNSKSGREDKICENNIGYIIAFESTRYKFPEFVENAAGTNFLNKIFDNNEVQIFKVNIPRCQNGLREQ
jgi:hypothetical protein